MAESSGGDDSATVGTREPCSVCLRPMPLRKDGAVRVHGPVGNRCSGSTLGYLQFNFQLDKLSNSEDR